MRTLSIQPPDVPTIKLLIGIKPKPHSDPHPVPIRNPVQVPQPLTVAEVVVAAVVEPSPPQTRAELLAAIADPKREFGLLTTAPSVLLAPAFRALDNFCRAKSMPLPAIWPAHERDQPLPQGCFIIKVSHPLYEST